MTEIAVDMKEIAGGTKVHAKIYNYKAWRWRLWVGVRLLRLAAYIMWMGIEFDNEEDCPTIDIR